MSVRFTQCCPTCGRRVQIRATLLGRTVACQHCKAEFVAQMDADRGIESADVLGMVLRQALVLTAAGLAIDLAVTLALSRVMSHFISGFGVASVPMVGAVALLLALATLAATWIPARRAARVDPANVLRSGS